ncbi:hypothetical protein [[Actinomadura] parvosata]
MHRPLAITEDPALLDDLVRIAAAAGAQLNVAPPPPTPARSGTSPH